MKPFWCAAGVLAGCVTVLLCSSRTVAGQINLWAIDDMVRIDPETGRAFEDDPARLPGCMTGDYRTENWIWSAKDRTVRLCGAKNEVIAFQVIIEGQAKYVTVEASPLRGPSGAVIPEKNIKLFREWYIWVDYQKPTRACIEPLRPGWYPDVAIPLTEPRYGNGFSIPSTDFHDPAGSRFPKQKNQAIWVDIHIPANARPGRYSGAITVNADGLKKSIAVVLDVWNFAIPAKIHMHSELMNYGQTIREPSRTMMYNYFKLAHEHRVTICDNKAKPPYDGRDYDWREFDDKFGPLFDGSIFTEGPTAGQPLPYWIFPIEYSIKRPDKSRKGIARDWPIPSPKTPSGCGVVFTPEFRRRLADAIRKYEEHFLKKGWTKTLICIWQDSLDEPGFHKSGKGLAAGREQAVTIYETAKLVKDLNLRLTFYKLDIGSGFARNKLDLDGDGKRRGPYDVANYLGRVVKMFSIQGLCVHMPALEPVMRKYGTEVIFYNGYNPRVGPNTINGELLGLRVWSVAAWRGGLAGWADWQFRRETGRKVFYEPNDDAGKNLYFYRGEHIGLPDKLFASLRLKSMRRGEQDYEMLRMLALKDGNDKRAQALASLVCGDPFRGRALGRLLSEEKPKAAK